MDKWLELQRKKTGAFSEARALLDTAKRENRGLTADERLKVQELTAAGEQAGREVRDREGVLARAGDFTYLSVGTQNPLRPEMGSATTHRARPAGKDYRSMFHSDKSRTLDNGGFQNFEEFLTVLDAGRHDPRLQKRAMLESVPSSGGFAVPEEFGAWLMDTALESEIVRPRAQVWPMKSETRKVPAWNNSDHSGGSLFGGFSIDWLAEGGTADRQVAKLRQLTLTAHKAGIYTQASRELIEDGLTFESQLGQAMTKALAWGLDYYYLNGSGAGQPLGVLNSPSIISVAKETGQPADTVIYENCCKMFARMHPASLTNAIWVANNTVMPQALMMTVSVGTGGSFIPAVMQANGTFTLMGRPLLFSEKLPVLGERGDILLVDFSQYAIGLRQEIIIDKSNVPGWLQDLQDYRAIIRTDAQPTWNQAITPKNGDSLSWAVTLEAR